MQDVFTWTAVYNDGTELTEFDENGEARGFALIDQSRLRAFVLSCGDFRCVLAVTQYSRPIFFRRRIFDIRTETHEGSRTVIGWQTTVNDTNIKSFVVFMEDGTLLVTDDESLF